MMERFQSEVKLFVLNERSEGKGWKIIKERIQERFNVTPPTTRAMQKWEQKLDRVGLSAEVMKDVKGKMGVIEAEALQSAQGLLATLWQAKDDGQDLEVAGWKWLFHYLDNRLGDQRFEILVDSYMRERKKPVPAPAAEVKNDG
jgi:hypothetical protein